MFLRKCETKLTQQMSAAFKQSVLYIFPCSVLHNELNAERHNRQENQTEISA